MNYISTRGGISPIGFQQAVMMGLADDGGLLIPESIPDVSDRLDEWRELSYADLAFEVIRLFAADMPAENLKALIDRTYGPAFVGGVAPVVRAGDLFVLELFHGPTLAFKDVALQLLGNLFEYILARTDSGSTPLTTGGSTPLTTGGSTPLTTGRLNILGATSGDTGSAAIAGCRGRKGIHIFIMHPAGRVSPIQQRQMTTVLDDNVHNIAVEGSFDDCQLIMKTLAADLEFKRTYSIGAVNSVNWARVLAQIVYYFSGVFDVQRATGAGSARVCVPTGNFGDILAGWCAMKMGAPISQLILATNENDILSRFYNTGEYSLGEVRGTLAPAMDIQVASNFERYLYYKVGCDADRLRDLMDWFARTGSLRIEPDENGVVDADFSAGAATTDDVLRTIRNYHERHGYLLDPHTACGVAVAERVRALGGGAGGDQRDGTGGPILCLATAHPAKFPAAIERATGKNLARHPAIDALADLPTRCKTLPNDTQAVRRFIVENVR